MKTKKLLLLCLLAFITVNATAMLHGGSKRIDLKRITTSSTINSKGNRSISLKAEAFWASDLESILVTFQNSSIGVELTVISVSTDKTIYANSFLGTESILINLSDLLNEGESYRLEISIGDTLLYGYFNF